MARLAVLAIAVGLGLTAASVSAQDAAVSATPEPTTTEPTPTPTATTPAEPSVPPVMVAVLASGHVPDDVVAAVQSSLVDGVRPLAGGRPVLALVLPEMRDRLAACADAACTGAFLGEAGAIGAIVARLSRRGTRGDVALTLDIVDPVSGAPRLPTQSASLADAAAVPTTLAPLVEALRAVMFSPPPAPPTLLVTVNVDGATVMIDEASVGESPIASQRLTPGHHVVMVTRAGYAGTRREVDLEPGEQARLDLNLAVLDSVSARAIAASESGAPPAATPWYEEWYVWVAVGAGVLVIAGIIIGAVVASQQTTPDPMGIPLPGLHF